MSIDSDMTTELLTPDELASWLKIPKKPGIYDLVAKREIPYRKIGGRLRFVKQEIFDYLESCRVESIGAKQHNGNKKR